MRGRVVVALLVVSSFLVPSHISAGQRKPAGGEIKFTDMYGGDEVTWDEHKEVLRKNLRAGGAILTAYLHIPCRPKPQWGRGMIGFLVARDGELLPFLPGLHGPRGVRIGTTSIPLDFKCGPSHAKGDLSIDVRGRVLTRGKGRVLRFVMSPRWNCVFRSDLPQHDPMHGKKCYGPSGAPGEFEMPFVNGHVTSYANSVFNFALEIVRK